jgi:hypothetical protein
MRHVLTAGLMMAFGLIFTATLSAVLQRVATARPAANHPFDVFMDAPRSTAPAADSGQDQALNCQPERPNFRLGSPFRQRERTPRDSEPVIVPGPTIRDSAPARRPI